MLTLNRYPYKGEKVRVEVMGKHGVKVITGRFTGQVFRVRSGAVLGVIDTSTGQTNVPWTGNKRFVVFYGENPDNYYQQEEEHISK